MINRLRKALLTQMERTAGEPTEEAVHDLRVAVRRLAEAVRLWGGGARAARQLRRIRDRAAAVRDRDVTIRLLRRPARDPIVIYLRGQRDFAAGELARYLRRRLRDPIETAPEQGTPRSLVSRAEAFLGASPSEPHALRIAAKRLRYAIEVLEPAGAEFWLNRLRRLQGQLGELHDLQVAAELIAALPGARPVAGELRARAAVLEARCQRQWQRNFGPRVRQRLLAWAKEAS